MKESIANLIGAAAIVAILGAWIAFSLALFC